MADVEPELRQLTDSILLTSFTDCSWEGLRTPLDCNSMSSTLQSTAEKSLPDDLFSSVQPGGNCDALGNGEEGTKMSTNSE